jgi:hypothetical protein
MRVTGVCWHLGSWVVWFSCCRCPGGVVARILTLAVDTVMALTPWLVLALLTGGFYTKVMVWRICGRPD